MNDAARQKLREIVVRHGAAVIENARRCAALLRDYGGGFRREISVLTMALEERVPADLLAPAKTTPRPVLFGRLTQRLCDNLALAEPAARWSVHSWAFALDLISAEELQALEQSGERQALNSAAVVSAMPAANNSAPINQPPSSAPDSVPNKFAVQKSVVVAADGSGDFAVIEDALGSVPPNARLVIRPGIYNESIVIDKNVEITGDGAAEDIVITGADSSCLRMAADKAFVRNLTLRGRGAQFGKRFFAVEVSRGELVLENCDVSSDTLSGLAIYGADSNPLIKNCRIHDGADSGIYIFDNARARIENCDVYRNLNANVAITRGAAPSIKNCRIFAGENGGVVVWANGAAGTIEDCEIFNHRLANVGVRQYADPVFRRCKIFGGNDSGIYVQQNGYGSFEECDVFDNGKAEIALMDESSTTLLGCAIHGGRESGVYLGNKARALIESCSIYENAEAGVAVHAESTVAVRRCAIRRNGKVAVRVKEGSAATVEESDLRGNRIAVWESEYGVTIERKNNRE